MNTVIEELHQFKNKTKQKSLKKFIDAFIDELNAINSVLVTAKPFLKKEFELKSSKKTWEQLLTQSQNKLKTELAKSDFMIWELGLNLIQRSIEQLPNQIEQVQHEDRFHSQEEDTFYVSFGKNSKRFKRSVKRANNKIANSLASLLKKDVVVLTPETQVIPFQLYVGQECISYLTKRLSDWRKKHHFLLTESARLLDEIQLAYISSNQEKLKSLEQSYLQKVEEIQLEIQSFSEKEFKLFDSFIDTLEINCVKLGTFELKPKSISLSETFDELKTLCNTTFKQKDTIWKQEWSARIDGIDQRLELLSFKLELNNEFEKLRQHINEYLTKSYKSKWIAFKELIHAKNEEIKSYSNSSKEKSIAFIQSVSTLLKENSLELHSTFDRENLNQSIVPFFDEYELKYGEHVQILSPQLTVITHVKPLKNTPDFDATEIDWSSLIHRIIEEEHLYKLKELPSKFLEVLLEAELKQQVFTEIIEVNAQAVVEMITEDENASNANLKFETLTSALNRVETQIEEWIEEQIQEVSTDLEEQAQQLEQSFTYLIEKLTNENLLDFESKRREIQVRSKALGFKAILEIYTAKSVDFFLIYSRFGIKKITAFIVFIQNTLFPKPKVDVKRSQQILGEYLTELRKEIDNLPLIYKKLFSLDHVKDLRYFSGLDKEVATFQNVVKQWNLGIRQTLAIIGESGSGKSFFTKKVLSTLDSELTVHTLSVKRTITNSMDLIQLMSKQIIDKEISEADELIEQLKASDRKVIVLDNLDNLFLRKVDGFKAVEELLVIINATSEHVLWVIHIGRYAWQYLNKVLKLSMYFSSEIETDKLAEHDLKSLITKRHRASGYQLRFEPDEKIANQRTYKKLLSSEEDRQDYLRSVYFKQAHEFADGNATISIIQWLSSIQEITTDEIVISVNSDWGIELPNSLSADEWFTLAYFVQHDTLKVENHAKAFHQSVQDSKLIFSRLEMMHIIESVDDAFAVTIFTYRPIIKALKKRNIIH